MYNFLTPLGLYKLIFVLEMVVALAITTGNLKRKKRFAARVSLSVAGVLLLALVFPIIWYDPIYVSCMFLVLFAVSVLALRLCYDEPDINLFFCGVLAYTTQHIAYETYNFLVTITGLENYGGMYLEEEQVVEVNLLSVFMYLASYVLIYWVIWGIVSYILYSEEKLDIGGYASRLFFSLVIVLVDVVLNSILVYNIKGIDALPSAIQVVLYLQSVLCCVLALVIQFTMLHKEAAFQEIERIKELWKMDKAMYERFRESTELINIKCHDLQHQIRALRQGRTEVSKEALEEIEEAIAIYNCKIKTGNQVLDVILAEKSLQCEYEHIRLKCIAQGDELNFLSADSLYAIFGNAITNAIEALKKTDDLEKRVIRLDVSRRNDMIFIHVENYCEDAKNLTFVNGLPETTKKNDEGYHGYGMRSMQLMAEKLGGGMEVHVDKMTFHLNFFLPVGKCRGHEGIFV